MIKVGHKSISCIAIMPSCHLESNVISDPNGSILHTHVIALIWLSGLALSIASASRSGAAPSALCSALWPRRQPGAAIAVIARTSSWRRRVAEDGAEDAGRCRFTPCAQCTAPAALSRPRPIVAVAYGASSSTGRAARTSRLAMSSPVPNPLACLRSLTAEAKPSFFHPEPPPHQPHWFDVTAVCSRAP